jgi:hypothetical protein
LGKLRTSQRPGEVMVLDGMEEDQWRRSQTVVPGADGTGHRPGGGEGGGGGIGSECGSRKLA